MSAILMRQARRVLLLALGSVCFALSGMAAVHGKPSGRGDGLMANTAPLAHDDAYVVPPGVRVVVAAPGVLANDTDADGDTLSAAPGAEPVSGSLTLSNDGGFAFQATTTGEVTFTYLTSDGNGASSTATVTIIVACAVGDVDTDGDGTCDDQDGDDDDDGLLDGEDLCPRDATNTCHLNAAPIARNDAYTIRLRPATTVAAPGVLANDTDANAHALTTVLVAAPASGTLSFAGNGSFTFEPEATGVVTFTYFATDGAANSAPATVTLTVVAPCPLDSDSDGNCNDTDRDDDADGAPDEDDPCPLDPANACDTNIAPVANDDTFVVTQGSTMAIAAPGLLANDTDADGDALTAAIVADAPMSALTFGNNGSFAYQGRLRGSVTFTYRAKDGNRYSAPATVTVIVDCAAGDTDTDGDRLCNATDIDDDDDGRLDGADECPLDATNTCNVNVAPVANDDAYEIPLRPGTTIDAPGVLANDTDANGDALTAVLDSAPVSGAFALDEDGSFTYESLAAGEITFTYHTNDGVFDSAPATVTLTIVDHCLADTDGDGTCDYNDHCPLDPTDSCDPDAAPVATDDAYSIKLGDVTTVGAPGVLSNDTDANGDLLTATLASSPASGVLTFNGNGSFAYQPTAIGVVSFTYRANDGSADSNVATVTLTVALVCPVDSDNDGLCDDTDRDDDGDGASDEDDPCPLDPTDGCDPNAAPLAADDAYAVTLGTPITIAAPGVLGNDTDADGDALTAVLGIGPLSGALSFNDDGSFVYEADAAGEVTFTYRAYDGTDASAPATVTLTVCAADTDGDGVCDAADGDDDGDGTPDDEDPCPSDPTDGCDPEAAPVANDDAFTVIQGVATPIAAPGVLANDIDANGDALTAVLVEDAPAADTLTFAGDGSFVYRAALIGSRTFTYLASDGSHDSAPATVTFTVTCAAGDADADGDRVCNATDDDDDGDNIPDTEDHCPRDPTPECEHNIAPVANGDAYTFSQRAASTVDAPGVLANDTDADGNPLTAVLDSAPSAGTLTLEADGSFTYEPFTVGEFTFTYHANDGMVDSAPATVTLTITEQCHTDTDGDGLCDYEDTCPLDPTDPLRSQRSADRGRRCLHGGAGTPLAIAAPGVLGNDTDTDGDALTAVLGDAPASGVLDFAADGSFTYEATALGVATFTYQAHDGTVASTPATVTLTMVADCPADTDHDGICDDTDGDDDGDGTPDGEDPCPFDPADGCDPDAAPVANDDAYTVIQGIPTSIAAPGVLANDTDANGDALTAVLVAGPPAADTFTFGDDGSFVYRAALIGTRTFTYLASDGSHDSAPATVTFTVTCAAGDADADGDRVCNNTDDDDDGDNIPDTEDHCPRDPTPGCDANTAPVANADAFTLALRPGSTVDAPGVLANDTDVDGNPLTAVLDTPPAAGAFTLDADGSFTYEPAAQGETTFTYHANDGEADSAPVTVTLTIVEQCSTDTDGDGSCDYEDPCPLDPVDACEPNAMPVAANDAYTVALGSLTTIAAPGVLGNDTDADGDVLTAVLGNLPASGVLTFANDGGFTYQPAALGEASFTYRANDGTIDSAPATVTFTVVPNCTLDTDGDGVCNDSDPDDDGDGTPDEDDPCPFDPADGCTPDAAPVANDDAFTVIQGVATPIAAPGVLANDTDANGDALSAVLVQGAADPDSMTLDVDGSFVYRGALLGTRTFTYLANDGSHDSAPATVTLTVACAAGDTDTDGDRRCNGNDDDDDGDGVPDGNDHCPLDAAPACDSNTPPVANADAYTFPLRTASTVDAPGVLANDTDVDSNPLTAVLDAAPAAGVFALHADGSFNYEPEAIGDITFTYHANDGQADSAPVTVTLTIVEQCSADSDGDGLCDYEDPCPLDPADACGPNAAPVATDDAYTVTLGTPLAIAAPGVLGNDTDADGDALTAILDNAPAAGVLDFADDGSFTYAPAAVGEVTFTYRANDGTANSAPATVTLTIVEECAADADDDGICDDTDPDDDGDGTPDDEDPCPLDPADGCAPNIAPVANDDAYTVTLGLLVAVPAPGVLANDTDADGDALTTVIEDLPDSGALTFNNDDGSLIYQGVVLGQVTFTYRASDGTDVSAPATVTFTIVPACTLDTDGDGICDDTDPDDDGDGNPDDEDPCPLDPIDVCDPNTAPVAGNDAYTVTLGTPLTINAPGVLGNDTDADGDALTAVLGVGPASGVLDFADDGSFTYQAAAVGEVSFTYQANDGTANSVPATVTLTIVADCAADTDGDGICDAADPDDDGDGNPDDEDPCPLDPTDVCNPNTAPVASDDAYTVTVGAATLVAAPGVLGNDTDADGDTLTAVLGAGPASGALAFGPDGSFAYTPAGLGEVTFTYQAHDGTTTSALATVTLTAVQECPLDADADGLCDDTDPDDDGDGTPDDEDPCPLDPADACDPNTAPVANDDAYTVTLGTLVAVPAPGVLANDTDADGDALTAVIETPPSAGALTFNTGDGGLLYQGVALGQATFTYRASDGTDVSAPATVTFTIVPACALDTDDDGVCDDTDPDDDGDGNPDDEDPCPLDPADVCDPNTAPVASDDAYTVTLGSATTIAAPGVLGNDTDADGDALTAVLDNAPASGVLNLATNGGFSYEPAAVGEVTFTYRANDGSADSAPATVTLTIVQQCALDTDGDGICDNTDPDDDGDGTPDDEDPCPLDPGDGCGANTAPVANADAYTVMLGTAITLTAPGVLGNDTDADGDVLTAQLDSVPAAGVLIFDTDGGFTYEPAAVGEVTFTYHAHDGTAASAPATVTLTIVQNCAFDTDDDGICDDTDPDDDGDGTPDDEDPCPIDPADGCDPNTAPVADDEAYAVTLGTPITIAAPGVLGNDTDADGDVLNAVLDNGPGAGVLAFNADGSFSYEPTADGVFTFTYHANDGAADSIPATVTLTVTPQCALDTDGDGVCDEADPDDDGDGTPDDEDPCPIDPADGCDPNTAPTANDDAYTVTLGAPIAIVAPGILGNDTDVDGDPLTAVLVTGPAAGIFTFNTDGSFAYEAAALGEVSFTYRANDGTADSTPATVTLTVVEDCAADADDDGICDDTDPDDDGDGTPDDEDPCPLDPTDVCNPNTAPVANDDAYTVTLGTPIAITAPGVLGNDTDIDGDALTAVLGNAPGIGRLRLQRRRQLRLRSDRAR